MKNYEVERLDAIEAVRCPCGLSRRAFVSPENRTATQHLVEISHDSRAHYHKRLTEIYLVLEGEGGHLELDGELIEARPMMSVLIRPGCRHRAVGRLKILVTAIPAFDPEDEWFDEE